MQPVPPPPAAPAAEAEADADVEEDAAEATGSRSSIGSKTADTGNRGLMSLCGYFLGVTYQ